MIAVTFALAAESSDFIRLLAHAETSSAGGAEIIRGELSGRAVIVCHTGVGEKVCRPRMERFLEGSRFDYLISAGFAGGIDSALHIADILIAENYSSTALLQSLKLPLAETAMSVGKLITDTSVVASLEQRAALARRTGAAAVDMETESIAASCAAHAVPMLSIRAISDTVDEPFPAPPEILFDVARQKTNLWRLAGHVATHPNALGQLLRFNRNIVRVRSALAVAVARVVSSDLA